MLNEHYISILVPEASTFRESLQSLKIGLERELAKRNIERANVVLLRFFCSDVYNQTPVIEKFWPGANSCQRVFIGQAPLDSAYISVQAYCLKEASRRACDDGALLLRHGGYQSIWCLDYPESRGDSESQTDQVIRRMQKRLAEHSMTVRDNVIRTWYYIRDIDNNYDGMIKSRVRHYEADGLTTQTHFIASTGIEGRAPNPHVLVALQTHAIKGLAPNQITYLKALDHLSPTSLYGVNFERATLVTYGDRKHCHISGTASIDAEGNVLHTGDVRRQMERALENVEALLLEGAMRLSDLKCATIYLRDSQDHHQVAPIAKSVLPKGCALNITHGAVCRPDWLVEIEGEAIAPCESGFANFI